MSKIIFDSGVSPDGFFADDNRSPGNLIKKHFVNFEATALFF